MLTAMPKVKRKKLPDLLKSSFFSSHLSSASGEDQSSTSVRAKIRKLIAAENPKKPLSDSKITNLLKEEGISVARRTVAKYREAMNIPSSSDRRKRETT